MGGTQVCESVQEPFPSSDSAPSSPSGLLVMSPIDFLSRGLGAHLLVQVLRVGCLMGGTNPLLLSEQLQICEIPPAFGCQEWVLANLHLCLSLVVKELLSYFSGLFQRNLFFI